jgi:hypothetical protein
MAILARVAPVMPTRPCRFCIGLQDDSVFADFEVDEDGRAFLVRISFDGYGCCDGEFRKMSSADSRTLIAAVERGSFEDPKIGTVLRSYFQENAGMIWEDALTTHALL